LIIESILPVKRDRGIGFCLLVFNLFKYPVLLKRIIQENGDKQVRDNTADFIVYRKKCGKEKRS
jgi:hypothetical protein